MPLPLTVRLGWKIKVHPDHYDMIDVGLECSGERNEGESVEDATRRLSLDAQLGLFELTIRQVEALNNLRSDPMNGRELLRWILNQIQVTQEQREALLRRSQ